MRTVDGHKVAMQAHRGVSTDCPENTMVAFRAAVEQGYDYIELDPKFTKDNVCVVLHDRTLDRTARTSAGEKAPEGTKICDITFAEACAYEYGSWFAAEFAGEKIPTLEEALVYARENNIPVKIDNVIESFTDEQTDILFSIIEKTNMQHLAGFTCTKVEYLKKVTARFPSITIHYDGFVDEDKLNAVCDALIENPLIVWLPYPTYLNSWCKAPVVSPERIDMVRAKGAKVGLWILEEEEHLADCCKRYKPDIIETTGSLKPDR